MGYLVPTICILWLIGFGLLLATSAQIRRRPARGGKSVCGSCGYSRTGLASEWLCPECGAEPSVTEEWKLSAQALLAFFVPLGAAVLVMLTMAVYGVWGIVVGLHGVIPLAVVAHVLMRIERHVSPRAMAGYALGSTLAAAGVQGWVSHMIVLFHDAQAVLWVFFAWIFGIGAAGLGLGTGWLVEMGMRTATARQTLNPATALREGGQEDRTE